MFGGKKKKGGGTATAQREPELPDWNDPNYLEKLTKEFGSRQDLGDAHDFDAELRAMGWTEEDGGKNTRKKASAARHAGRSGADSAGGIDLAHYENVGIVDEDIHLTDADMNDPELLAELDGVHLTEEDFDSDSNDGGGDGGSSGHALGQLGEDAGGDYSDVDESAFEDGDGELSPSPRVGLARGGSSFNSQSSDKGAQALEAAIATQKQRALAFKKAGDPAKAMEAMREAKRMERELAAQRKLNAAAAVAAPTEHRQIAATTAPRQPAAPAPAVPARSAPPPLPNREASAASLQKTTTAPENNGSDSGVGGQMDRAAVIAQLWEKVGEYKRLALALKKEGRNAEALVQLKRARAIEGDLQRAEANNGGGGGGGGTFGSTSSAASNGGGDIGGDLRVPGLRRGRSSNSGGASSTNGSETDLREATLMGGGSRRGTDPFASGSVAPGAAASAGAGPRAAATLVPAGPDAFSDLEAALKVAARAHLERAKALVSTDRAAAAAEKRKVEAYHAELARVKEVRTIPGAVPPPYHWEMTRKNRIKVIKEVGMEEVELSLGKMTGLAGKLGSRKQAGIFVSYDLGYARDDKAGQGVTRDVAAAGDEADLGHVQVHPLKRSKGTQLAFTHRKASFEVMRRKALWGQELVAKVVLPLSPLLTACELMCHAPLLSEGRREIGGTLEVRLRLCKPIQSDEVTVVEEKELVVGHWPTVILPPGAAAVAVPAAASANGAAALTAAAVASGLRSPDGSGSGAAAAGGQRSPDASAKAAAALAAAADGFRSVDAGARAAAAATAHAAAVAAASGLRSLDSGVQAAAAATAAAANAAAAAAGSGVVLTEDEMEDPLAALHIDSNNVLEAEIAGMGVPVTPEQMVRKSQLETKLMCLVAAVQNEELSLDSYLDMLRKRSERDRALALWLKKEGRIKEAGAVARRIKMMREELESAPDDGAEA